MSATIPEIDREIVRCLLNPAYFVYTYCKVLDEQTGQRIPFHLWPAQTEVLKGLASQRLVCLLKGRQIGITTIVLAYLLWFVILKKPGSTVLLFSKGKKESKELIERLRWMVNALPEWLQPAGVTKASTEELAFTNGSRFVSFASRSSGGDSYTASVVVVDEADLIPDLNQLLTGAKPTVSAGGQLILLSRVDKSEPKSAFKNIYRGALSGDSGFWAKFLPWWSAPWRDRAWYEAERKEILARTGSEDELYENHPATPEQALAGRTLDKRFPLWWVEGCYRPQNPLDVHDLPASLAGLPALRIYALPQPGRSYVGGVDPAQGNPTSDDSVCVMVDAESLEEVATICGKVEPSVLADHSAALAVYFNAAGLMVERNNHGHAVLLRLRDYSVPILKGQDGQPGWNTTAKSKTFMWDRVAEQLRPPHRCVIHSREVMSQLGNIDVNSQSAPKGQHDDLAVGMGLAVAAAVSPVTEPFVIVSGPPAPQPVQPGERKGPSPSWKGLGGYSLPRPLKVKG